MAAPYGKANVEIGGKDYTLVFNFGAMAAIENHPYGAPFQSLAKELAPNEDGSPKDDMKLSTAALLLWGCFRAKHAHVSFDQSGEMLLGDDASAAVGGLMECLANAFPDGEVENPPKRAKAGTGTSS
jgi:hypothetical protein